MSDKMSNGCKEPSATNAFKRGEKTIYQKGILGSDSINSWQHGRML